MSATASPRLARWSAIDVPTMPAPSTMASVCAMSKVLNSPHGNVLAHPRSHNQQDGIMQIFNGQPGTRGPTRGIGSLRHLALTVVLPWRRIAQRIDEGRGAAAFIVGPHRRLPSRHDDRVGNFATQPCADRPTGSVPYFRANKRHLPIPNSLELAELSLVAQRTHVRPPAVAVGFDSHFADVWIVDVAARKPVGQSRFDCTILPGPSLRHADHLIAVDDATTALPAAAAVAARMAKTSGPRHLEFACSVRLISTSASRLI